MASSSLSRPTAAGDVDTVFPRKTEILAVEVTVFVDEGDMVSEALSSFSVSSFEGESEGEANSVRDVLDAGSSWNRSY